MVASGCREAAPRHQTMRPSRSCSSTSPRMTSAAPMTIWNDLDCGIMVPLPSESTERCREWWPPPAGLISPERAGVSCWECRVADSLLTRAGVVAPDSAGVSDKRRAPPSWLGPRSSSDCSHAHPDQHVRTGTWQAQWAGHPVQISRDVGGCLQAGRRRCARLPSWGVVMQPLARPPPPEGLQAGASRSVLCVRLGWACNYA